MGLSTIDRNTGRIKLQPPQLPKMEENMSKGRRPILLVEDNPMDADLTLESFKQHNLANPVIVVPDGEEAVNFIDQHLESQDPQLPLLVLLDLRLPKVDGLDVLQHARRQEVWKKLPFVVLTTSREDKDIHRAYELGANSYIVKPVNFDAFAAIAGSIKVYWLLTNENAFPETLTK
jgi:CheY-like chemotaxis protein